ASSNDDTASTAADTRAPSEWTAGWVSASSPTTSSTSVASWKSRRLLESSRPRPPRKAPPVIRRGLCYQDQLITIPQTPILRREVDRAGVGCIGDLRTHATDR